ncbi:MAG: hypothetical protein K2H56_03300 [Malacoplasma sp.]|nr:hypothetical protein [Malacoplasma sp.]MDE5774913.1 hypothetical protein [Malacoplasma sp.]
MNSKKRILITSSVGAAAVIAGVSPAIASNTNTQSSTVNVPVDPVNPDDQKNPNNPDDQKDPVNPDDPVDPVDPDDPVDPVDPDDPVDPVDPVEPTYATAPSEDNFTLQFALYTMNDKGLNDYFKNKISNSQYEGFIEKNFANADQYTNVNITYVPDSASFATNSFQVYATPIEDAIWENTKDDSSQRIVTVKIDNSAKSPDATVPIKSKNSSFNVAIKDKNIKTNTDLNKWLSNYFKTTYKLTDFTPATPDNIFKNVNLSYVENSADLANKSFKVKATPLAGHAWANNTFYKNTIVDSFDMDIWIGNIIDANKMISLPERWSNSIIINSVYRDFNYNKYLIWEMLGFFFDTDYLSYDVSAIPEFKKRFDSQMEQNKWYFFREGLKELAKYYPVEQAYWDAIRYDKVERVSGGVALDYSILCYPKAGYYWEDGTNSEKWVPMRLFVSSEWDVGKSWVLGSTYNLTDIVNYNKENEKSPLPTRSWVTNKLLSVKNDILVNGTFEENKKIVEKIIMDDLEKNFPDYYIQVTDLQSASPNEPQDIKGNWKYKVRFILKTDKFAISDFIDGYIFSDGWPIYTKY